MDIYGANPDGSSLDTVTTSADSSAPAWWQQTLGYVITAAAKAKYSPQLQSGVAYTVDANGNVVPVGVAHPSATTGGTANPSGAMQTQQILLLAVVGFVIYKLVK